MTTVENKEVINLIRASFSSNGMIIAKGKAARQAKANQILSSEVSYYGKMVDGYDAHSCLLMIANPNANI